MGPGWRGRKLRACKYFSSTGEPQAPFCPRSAEECHFIHPEDDEWPLNAGSTSRRERTSLSPAVTRRDRDRDRTSLSPVSRRVRDRRSPSPVGRKRREKRRGSIRRPRSHSRSRERERGRRPPTEPTALRSPLHASTPTIPHPHSLAGTTTMGTNINTNTNSGASALPTPPSTSHSAAAPLPLSTQSPVTQSVQAMFPSPSLQYQQTSFTQQQQQQRPTSLTISTASLQHFSSSSQIPTQVQGLSQFQGQNMHTNSNTNMNSATPLSARGPASAVVVQSPAFAIPATPAGAGVGFGRVNAMQTGQAQFQSQQAGLGGQAHGAHQAVQGGVSMMPPPPTVPDVPGFEATLGLSERSERRRVWEERITILADAVAAHKALEDVKSDLAFYESLEGREGVTLGAPITYTHLDSHSVPSSATTTTQDPRDKDKEKEEDAPFEEAFRAAKEAREKEFERLVKQLDESLEKLVGGDLDGEGEGEVGGTQAQGPDKTRTLTSALAATATASSTSPTTTMTIATATMRTNSIPIPTWPLPPARMVQEEKEEERYREMVAYVEELSGYVRGIWGALGGEVGGGGKGKGDAKRPPDAPVIGFEESEDGDESEEDRDRDELEEEEEEAKREDGDEDGERMDVDVGEGSRKRRSVEGGKKDRGKEKEEKEKDKEVDEKVVERVQELEGYVTEVGNLVMQQEEQVRETLEDMVEAKFAELRLAVEEDEDEEGGEGGEGEAEDDMNVDIEGRTSQAQEPASPTSVPPPSYSSALQPSIPASTTSTSISTPLTLRALTDRMVDVESEVKRANSDLDEMSAFLVDYAKRMGVLEEEWPRVIREKTGAEERFEDNRRRLQQMLNRQDEDHATLRTLQNAMRAHASALSSQGGADASRPPSPPTSPVPARSQLPGSVGIDSAAVDSLATAVEIQPTTTATTTAATLAQTTSTPSSTLPATPATDTATIPSAALSLYVDALAEPVMDELRERIKVMVEGVRRETREVWEREVGEVYRGVWEKVGMSVKVMEAVEGRLGGVGASVATNGGGSSSDGVASSGGGDTGAGANGAHH